MAEEKSFEKWIKAADLDANKFGEPVYSINDMKKAFEAGQKNCDCVHTDNSAVIKNLQKQIEKMKCCENCAWWYKLPNGQRDCAEHCENLDNWSLRR